MRRPRTFFTADTHFGHANIIRYAHRPWIDWDTDVVEEPDKVTGEMIQRWVSPEIARKRADEMDEVMIAKWNNVVKPNDLVYHLGDFCFGKTTQDFAKYFERLNGDIIFIKGNHDELAWKNSAAFVEAYDSYLEIEIRQQAITLCHYAMRVWNRSHYGSWHLYGHSHGTLPGDHMLSFDVGVDCHDFQPITFERVREIMATKQFKPIISGTISPIIQTYTKPCTPSPS
jgi:calcineurin-like phosphoesterase family protein